MQNLYTESEERADSANLQVLNNYLFSIKLNSRITIYLQLLHTQLVDQLEREFRLLR